MRLGKCMYSREWIKNPRRNTDDYIQGVRHFMKFAKYHSSPDSEICSCPCKKCRNAKRLDFQTVEKHLIVHGMDPIYNKWFFHGESNMTNAASFEEYKNDSMVEEPDKKKSCCCEIGSSASVKQVKKPLATKSNVNMKDRDELLLRVMETQKQIDDAVKSVVSTFQSKLQNMLQAVQHNQLGSNMTLKTEASSSNTKYSFTGNQIDNSVASTDEVESSSNEKQYVMLLSWNLEEVAKGFIETFTECDGIKVVHKVEKIVCVTEVIEPESPIFDGPRNGKYKLCDVGNGGHVLWPVFRLRIL